MIVAFPMKKRDLLLHAALVFSNLAAMMACDREGITTCAHKYLVQTPKIRLVESKGKKAIIEAACKWARDHTACLATVLRGCKQETIDLLESAFATFNEDPLNCNVSLNGVIITGTVFNVVFASLLAFSVT